ncbi:MAG: hypothetical protein ABC585_05480 [Candidatus Methanosuratincola petrocarbonis]
MEKIENITGLKIECIGELTFFAFEGTVCLNGKNYKVKAMLRKGWKGLNGLRDEEYELKITEPDLDRLEKQEGLKDKIEEEIVKTLDIYQLNSK